MNVLPPPLSLSFQLFYRQYIFTVCVPVMLQLFTGSAQLVKECVLVSLSHLMQSVPKSVLIPELPKVSSYYYTVLHFCTA